MANGDKRRQARARCYNRAVFIARIGMSYLGSAIAILVCGGFGTALAWFVVAPLGLDGVAAGLATAFAAMIAATLLFACGVALRRALQLFR